MPEIKATEQPLMDIFNDKYIFSIPPFQRPYRMDDRRNRGIA